MSKPTDLLQGTLDLLVLKILALEPQNGWAISLRLKVTKAGRSMLKPGHKLKATLNLTLRDAGGNRRSLKKTVTVRRP